MARSGAADSAAPLALPGDTFVGAFAVDRSE